MTTGELQLRPETEEDTTFLKSLYYSTRADLQQLGLPPALLDNMMSMQFHAQRSSYRSRFPDSENSIVEKYGKPIGELVKHAGTADIRLVYIALLPEERGKGYGRRLIGALQSEAARAGKALALAVDPLNPAKKLYLSLGFQVALDEGINLEMIWRADAVLFP